MKNNICLLLLFFAVISFIPAQTGGEKVLLAMEKTNFKKRAYSRNGKRSYR